MAKKVITISKGGSPSSVTQKIVTPKGPRPPSRLNAAPTPPAPAPEPVPQKRIITAASKARPATVAEPQRRIVTAASKNRAATPAPATPPAKQNASGKPQPPKKKPAGPPPWLIPVGIIGLILLIVIIVSVSSNSRRDPYFDNNGSAQYQERKPYVDPNANRPRPMKEYMEQNGPSEMAKERMARMKKRPTTTATQPSN